MISFIYFNLSRLSRLHCTAFSFPFCFTQLVFCAGDVGDASAAALMKPQSAHSAPAEVAAAARLTACGKGDGLWTELELRYIFDLLLKNSDEATRVEQARKFQSYGHAPLSGQLHTNYP